jgi:hypothetical protein
MEVRVRFQLHRDFLLENSIDRPPENIPEFTNKHLFFYGSTLCSQMLVNAGSGRIQPDMIFKFTKILNKGFWVKTVHLKVKYALSRLEAIAI